MIKLIFRASLILSIMIISTEIASSAIKHSKCTELGNGWTLKNHGQGTTFSYDIYKYEVDIGDPLGGGYNKLKKSTAVFDCVGEGDCVSVDGNGYIWIWVPEGIEQPTPHEYPIGVLPPEQIPEEDGVTEKDAW